MSINEITKSGLPQLNSVEHARLVKAIQEQSPEEFKADSRIRSFMEFGDFQPRPDAVQLAPQEKPSTLKTFFDMHPQECSGNNEEAGFNLCREMWCSENGLQRRGADI